MGFKIIFYLYKVLSLYIYRNKFLKNFYFSKSDAIANLGYQVDDPNDRNHAPTNLGTWSSVSDVDTFLRRFNHASAYKDGNNIKLRAGDYVTILDGTYNQVWEIAGFDMEHNQKAADGTTYDNGYGICLIPRTQVTTAKWNESMTVKGGYKASSMHNTHLPNIVSKLENVLGSHIVTRNALLSSSVDSNYYSNNYTWTTSKATLMSAGQMTGTFGSYSTKYDDGEANYKLPIFNSKNYYYAGNGFWTRGVCGNDDGGARYVDRNGDINVLIVIASCAVRPLIYLR